MTLGEARAELRQLVRDGERCPCCDQFAKVYRRKLNSGMARSLIAMWRTAGTSWVHVPTALDARSREEGKLRYWGLVVESDEERDDGGRAGWWQVTDLGAQFVLGQLRVPQYAHVYDGRCLGLHGDPVMIRDCLTDRFSYEELMGR